MWNIGPFIRAHLYRRKRLTGWAWLCCCRYLRARRLSRSLGRRRGSGRSRRLLILWGGLRHLRRWRWLNGNGRSRIRSRRRSLGLRCGWHALGWRSRLSDSLDRRCADQDGHCQRRVSATRPWRYCSFGRRNREYGGHQMVPGFLYCTTTRRIGIALTRTRIADMQARSAISGVRLATNTLHKPEL